LTSGFEDQYSLWVPVRQSLPDDDTLIPLDVFSRSKIEPGGKPIPALLPSHQGLQALLQETFDRLPTCLGNGVNSICYKTTMKGQDGIERDVILKEARLNSSRTNPDTTFRQEADLLLRLTGITIQDVPAVIGRFQYGNRHFLVVSFVPGCHPHVIHNPFLSGHLTDLSRKLFLLDSGGFIHYDLQIPNILLDRNRVGLIDFEFGEQIDPTEAYLEEKKVFYEDYNVSVNPYFPMRSSLSNFEFRSLFDYLQKLCLTVSKSAATSFLHTFLENKSLYHRMFCDHLNIFKKKRITDISRNSKRTLWEVARLMNKAIAYEGVLSDLYADATREIASCEYMLMKYRYCLFNRDFNQLTVNMESLYRSSFKRMNLFASASESAGQVAHTEYFKNMLATFEKLRVKEIRGRKV
jgi:tRNA A-37 threonylcarbamoyl transferase component Bud32